MKHEAVADFYNNIRTKFGDDYESKRWFRSPVTRSHFEMATRAIHDVVSKCHFKSCFELGPGAGTWTKLLLVSAPEAEYTLLDISETMLSIAKKNLVAHSNIAFVTSDFLAYDAKNIYDFFFSSRALEYIVDKKSAVKKIHDLLDQNGEGVLITKNPRYWADRLLRKEVPELHRNQITPRALKALLEEVGFEVVLVRPVTVTVPFFKSHHLNNFVFSILHNVWLPLCNFIFMESYIVHFKKHGN